MIGESHEVHVGGVRQTRHIRQRGFQRAGAVGIGGVGVELAEVELILRRAHGEGPGLAGLLAVGALDGDGHVYAAVGHSFRCLIADHAFLVSGRDCLAVESHGDGGILAGVGNFDRDDGSLVLAGLAARCGRQVGEDRLVQHGDVRAAAEGHALGVFAGHRDRELIAGDLLHRNGYGVNSVLQCGSKRRLAQLHSRLAVKAKHRIDGKAEAVLLADIGLLHGAEHHLGSIDNPLGHVHRFAHGVEVEGVDRIVGHVVHAVGLVAVSIILKILAVLAVVFCGTALHGEAAVARGQDPVGVVGRVLGIEGVVAGAVGAEVAVVLVVEAEVVAVLLHGEDPRAVLRHGLAVGDLSANAGDGGAVGVVILTGQHALGADVVDDDLIAGLRQTAFGGLLLLPDHQIELLGKEGLVAADRAVGAPVALAGVPLDVAAAHGVLDVEAIRGSGGEDLPVGVHIVERGAREARAHGELLAVGGGEGIAAVCIHAHGPDLGGAVAGQLAVGIGNVNARVVVAVVSLGQGFHVGGVEDDDLGPVGQLAEVGDDVVFLLHMGFDLRGEGIAELERGLVDTHGRLDVDLVAYGVFPVALGILVDNGPVELDGVALGILDGDVGCRVSAAVVVDLGDLKAGELHIGADIGSGQRADGRGFGLQGQAGGFLIGGLVQFGQTIVNLEAAGGDDGVAQADVGGLSGHEGADAAGLILDVDVLAVHQGHNALDGEAGSFRAGQRFGYGIVFRGGFGNALSHQLIEGEAKGVFVQPVGAGAVDGKGGDAAEPLDVHIAVGTGQVAAGNVVGLVRRDAVAERPLGAAGRIGAEVEGLFAAVGGELLLTLREAVGAVGTGRNRPLDGLARHVRSVDGDVAVGGGLGVAAQISGVALRIDGGDGVAAVRVEDQNRVAILGRVDQLIDGILGLDVLPGLFGLFGLDRVGTGGLGAVVHAFLRGLDREGGVLIHGDGAGVGFVIAGSLINDRRALGFTAEADLGALIHFTCSGAGSGGGYGLNNRGGGRVRLAPGFFDLVQLKLGGITARVAGNGGVLIGTELILAAFVACQRDRIGSLTSKSEIIAAERNSPAIAAGNNTVVVSSLGSNRDAVAVGEGHGTIVVDGDRPHRAGCIRRGNRHRCQPAVIINTRCIVGARYHHILAGNQFLDRCDLRIGCSTLRISAYRQHGYDHDHQQQYGKHSAQAAFVHP